MIFVGIDIAKLKHFASAMTNDGVIVIDSFSFKNNTKGFNLLLSQLNRFEKEDMINGMESTAHYGMN